MNFMTQQFPPPPDQRVTLANWRTPPFNRWAFNHVSELVPSARIAAASTGTPAPASPLDLSDFRLEHHGKRLDLTAWLNATYTDSIVILKDGKIVFENYTEGQSPELPHIWMSVSKSVLGLIAGIAAERGFIDLAAPITSVLPELSGSAYAGAAIRDALDMRVGIRFNEDYHAKDGAIIAYRKSHLWDPLPVGEAPSDMRSFFSSLTERDGDHHGRFHYVSPNTDVLGWVLERATRTRFADLVSQWLWQPVHAERDAYITVDRFGAPRCAGGLCAGPRDLAKVARLFATGGRCGNAQVVPQAWLDDILNFDGRAAWQSGDFEALFNGADMHYRSQWYVMHGRRPLVFGLGVYGQNVFVDPAADLVITKCSSQPLPLDTSFIDTTLAGVEKLRALLS